MSELGKGTTAEAFWSNVELEMRRGVQRQDAIRVATRTLNEACEAAGVEPPELWRADADSLLPELPEGDLSLDDSWMNQNTRPPKT